MIFFRKKPIAPPAPFAEFRVPEEFVPELLSYLKASPLTPDKAFDFRKLKRRIFTRLREIHGAGVPVLAADGDSGSSLVSTVRYAPVTFIVSCYNSNAEADGHTAELERQGEFSEFITFGTYGRQHNRNLE